MNKIIPKIHVGAAQQRSAKLCYLNPATEEVRRRRRRRRRQKDEKQSFCAEACAIVVYSFSPLCTSTIVTFCFLLFFFSSEFFFFWFVGCVHIRRDAIAQARARARLCGFAALGMECTLLMSTVAHGTASDRLSVSRCFPFSLSLGSLNPFAWFSCVWVFFCVCLVVRTQRRHYGTAPLLAVKLSIAVRTNARQWLTSRWHKNPCVSGANSMRQRRKRWFHANSHLLAISESLDAMDGILANARRHYVIKKTTKIDDESGKFCGWQ